MIWKSVKDKEKIVQVQCSSRDLKVKKQWKTMNHIRARILWKFQIKKQPIPEKEIKHPLQMYIILLLDRLRWKTQEKRKDQVGSKNLRTLWARRLVLLIKVKRKRMKWPNLKHLISCNRMVDMRTENIVVKFRPKGFRANRHRRTCSLGKKRKTSHTLSNSNKS